MRQVWRFVEGRLVETEALKFQRGYPPLSMEFLVAATSKAVVTCSMTLVVFLFDSRSSLVQCGTDDAQGL